MSVCVYVCVCVCVCECVCACVSQRVRHPFVGLDSESCNKRCNKCVLYDFILWVVSVSVSGRLQAHTRDVSLYFTSSHVI